MLHINEPVLQFVVTVNKYDTLNLKLIYKLFTIMVRSGKLQYNSGLIHAAQLISSVAISEAFRPVHGIQSGCMDTGN